MREVLSPHSVMSKPHVDVLDESSTELSRKNGGTLLGALHVLYVCIWNYVVLTGLPSAPAGPG